jgi:Secretion system C-terminal sorting domain
MKYLLTLLFFGVSVSFVAAQVPSVQWQKALGGCQSDEAFSVQQTTDGGFILFGTSNSTDSSLSQVTGNHGSFDYWVVKTNDTGAIQWEKSFGGSLDETGYFIRQTQDGGYIAIGGAESSDGNVTCSIPEWDYWVLKLDDTGGTTWTTCLGGSSYNVGWCVQQTQDLGYIVVGNSYSADSGITDHHGSTSFADYWVVKLSSSGNVMWKKSFGGSNNDQGKFIQSTSDGGFIVVGSSKSNDGQVSGNHLLNPTTTSTDIWVVKIDDTGAVQWQKSLGGSGEDFGKGVIQTTDGGYAIIGSSNSLDTALSQVTGNHGGYDYWVVKLDDTGAILWQKSLGGSGDETGNYIQQTFDSGYIVSGHTNSTDGQVTGNHGDYDHWIVKLSKTGAMQWEKCLGGSTTDHGNAVLQTPDSGFVAAGSALSNDSEVSGNHGDYDFWVVKLSACRLDSAIITATGSTMHTVMPYMHYQWFFNGTLISGATNPTYTATVNGTYEVNVSDSNECVASSHAYNLTTVKTNSITENGNIYTAPNPTSGNIYITGTGYNRVEIYNTVGEKKKSVSGTDRISIAELPAGLYFIKIYDAEGELLLQNKVIKL